LYEQIQDLTLFSIDKSKEWSWCIHLSLHTHKSKAWAWFLHIQTHNMTLTYTHKF